MSACIQFILISIFILLTYYIHTHIYFHPDVFILMHSAKMMLWEGQTYAHYIFEPNPPLIFYIYMPIVILAQWTGINLTSILTIYCIILIVISLLLSQVAIKQIFYRDHFIINAIMLGLCFVLFFLPCNQFAQREHFLIILTLPYFFLAALRLENSNAAKINRYYAMIIGILAGIGFSIKPHFLSALLLVELYFIYQKRSIWGWLRIESILILLIIFCYLLIMILVYPQYLTIVIPLWIPYYQARVEPWWNMLDTPFLFCLIISLCYGMTYKINHYLSTSTVFLFGLIGLMIGYFMPRVTWFYHIYPAIVLAYILGIILLVQIIKLAKTTWNIVMPFIILFGIIFLSSPINLTIIFTGMVLAEFKDKTDDSQLIHFMEEHYPNNTYDYFSVVHKLIKIEGYGKAKYIGSVPFFYWEYNQKTQNINNVTRQQEMSISGINLIAHDLNIKKPNFVIIDTLSANEYLGKNIDYINRYSQYAEFRKAWSNYYYMKNIGRYQIFERNS